MTENYEYFENKRSERTYVSKAFPSFSPVPSEESRNLRIISKVFDEPELHECVEQKGEMVLHTTLGERQEVKAIFYEDTREVQSLTIQRFTRQTGKPHKRTHFTFSGKSLEKIYNLLRIIKHLNLEDGEKARLDDELIDELFFSVEDKKRFLIENLDLVQEIAENTLTKSDVIALAYRKKQLEIFEQLLYDDVFFEKIELEWGKRGKEAVWQQFFENNPWIFGYGLNYIYTSKLDDRKLEQVVAGYSVVHSGKRVDALMKTRGLINSLCFVEIKTHKTKLLHGKPYRPECWRISNELAGCVSQIQKTIQKAVKEIQTKVEFTSLIGNPTGETAFLYQPKSFVVVGSLDEFVTQNGVNEQQFSSFEIFRRNITNPEIITFDELFERAKYIVQHSKQEDETKVDDLDWGDDIPF